MYLNLIKKPYTKFITRLIFLHFPFLSPIVVVVVDDDD